MSTQADDLEEADAEIERLRRQNGKLRARVEQLERKLEGETDETSDRAPAQSEGSAVKEETWRQAGGADGSPTETGGASGGRRERLELDEENVAKGLGQLVLTVVKLLHEVLEKQGIRRMEAGRLTAEEIERIGSTLKRQAEEIERLCDEFDLEPDDLDLDIGMSDLQSRD